jgi:flavin reductase (DIM6/NTAB) family NADH-FMN oxidoreductase RutF
MSKSKMGPQPLIFPNPAVLVGAIVNGKPNFSTYAWAGVTGGKPPTVAVGMQPHRYTLKGVRENMAFSVNIPSEGMVKEADYCGLVSGADTDKVKDCGFKIFYGSLEKAPLIEQCPVNLECRVRHILDLGSHMLVIGEVVETHASEECLTEGKPDIMKIKPLVYSRGPKARYNAVGEAIGDAFSIGKGLKSDKSK